MVPGLSEVENGLSPATNGPVGPDTTLRLVLDPDDPEPWDEPPPPPPPPAPLVATLPHAAKATLPASVARAARPLLSVGRLLIRYLFSSGTADVDLLRRIGEG